MIRNRWQRPGCESQSSQMTAPTFEQANTLALTRIKERSCSAGKSAALRTAMCSLLMRLGQLIFAFCHDR